MIDVFVFLGSAIYDGRFLLAGLVVFWFVLVFYDLAIYHFGKLKRDLKGWFVYLLPDILVIFGFYFGANTKNTSEIVTNILVFLVVSKIVRWSLKYL